MEEKKKKKDIVYTAKEVYPNQFEEVIAFPKINIKIAEIETAMLLMHSKENQVLYDILYELCEYIRLRRANIKIITKHNVFDALYDMAFYHNNQFEHIRRHALYLADAIVEYQPVLQELSTERLTQIATLCISQYLDESDDICLEYLTVIINNCMDDPQVAALALNEKDFLNKLFTITASLSNPDTIYHSFLAIHKMLLVQKFEDMQIFASHLSFPIDRALCELINEFPEIRSAALKVISALVLDCSEEGLFKLDYRAQMLMQQITQMLCEITPVSEARDGVEVLSLALRSERMVTMYFHLDLFEKLVQYLSSQENMEMENICIVSKVFCEMCAYPQYHKRIHESGITNWMVNCLLQDQTIPAKHVFEGLLRLMKHPDAAKTIVSYYETGLLDRLTFLIQNPHVDMKIRENCSKLLNALLMYSFHATAVPLLALKYMDILAEIFSVPLADLSVDFLLLLLQSIEELAKYDTYRDEICKNVQFIRNLAMFLWNAFSASMLVTNIIRCMCTLLDEEEARLELLDHHVTSSIKRALQSCSNLLKTAATNFIMQTTRFPEYIGKYTQIHGVLEVLILHQKHSFCVATWNPAIEAILAKSPTHKFALRNCLNFTDTTIHGDFLVPKLKLCDFMMFQELLNCECSPLSSMIIVNFERSEVSPENIIHIPRELLENEEQKLYPEGWAYCRYPADENLPKYLDQLNQILSAKGLLENPEKMRRCIDFDNMTARIKIVAEMVAEVMGNELKALDINSPEECMRHVVDCHYKELRKELHCSVIPLGKIRTGCQFERAILFKALADQIGLPATLQRSVDGKILFNEVPLPVVIDQDPHCRPETLKYMSWRMLRPTHVVDLLFNVGEVYALQTRQALQYLRLY